MYGVTQVTDVLWVGGDPEFSGNLKEDIAKINTLDLVIDVRDFGEGKLLGWKHHVGTRTIEVNMYDDGRRANNVGQFNQLARVVQARADEMGVEPTDVKVFIHCHMGVNRSPSAIMYLLMKFHGYTPVGAFTKVRETRTCAGLAYADVAVKAAMDGLPEWWHDWEDEYWATPGTITSVNSFIKQNRAIERGTAWVDGKGMVHVTGKKDNGNGRRL